MRVTDGSKGNKKANWATLLSVFFMFIEAWALSFSSELVSGLSSFPSVALFSWFTYSCTRLKLCISSTAATVECPAQQSSHRPTNEISSPSCSVTDSATPHWERVQAYWGGWCHPRNIQPPPAHAWCKADTWYLIPVFIKPKTLIQEMHVERRFGASEEVKLWHICSWLLHLSWWFLSTLAGNPPSL